MHLLLALTWLTLADPRLAARAPASGKLLVVLVDAVGAPDDLRAGLGVALQSEVERSANHRWQDPPAISMDELALALNCGNMDEPCARRAGESVRADEVLLVSVFSSKREVALALIQVKQGKPAHSERIPLGDTGSTLQAIRTSARQLLGPVRPTRLVVTTDPAGAAVSLDGQALGTSPHTANDLPEGRHQLAVTLEGFAPQASDVELVAGQSVEVRLSLKPAARAAVAAPAPVPPATSGEAGEAPASGGISKWVVIGPGLGILGLGGLGMGVGLLAAALTGVTLAVLFAGNQNGMQSTPPFRMAEMVPLGAVGLAFAVAAVLVGALVALPGLGVTAAGVAWKATE